MNPTHPTHLATPPQCPKWNACRAPYCPLDPSRSAAVTRRGEASCRWLREAVKSESRIPEALREPVEDSLRLVRSGVEGGPALRRALQRAAGSARKGTP